MAKKSNGEGSIFFRKSINKWVSVITIGTSEDGKQKRKTFYGDTKKEVIEKVKKYEANTFSLNRNLEESNFDDWFKRWLYALKKPKLKPKSWQRYEGLYTNYIQNAPFKSESLAKITSSEIDIWYIDLAQSISESQIKYIHDLIKASFELAVSDRLITHNPAKSIKIKVTKSENINVLSQDEQKILVNYLSCKTDNISQLLLFALGTGMRLGEILAVTWDDYDASSQTITVNKNLQRIKNDDGTYTDKIGTTKTNAGTRTIPLPDKTISLLESIFNDTNVNSRNLIFYANDGYYIYNSTPTRHLHKACQKLNINDITLHGLRHTYTTRLFENNVQIKTVQKLLGHSDVETTLNIYTHVMHSVKENAVEKLNDFL